MTPIFHIANGTPACGQQSITNIPGNQLVYTWGDLRAILDQVSDIATQGVPIGGGSDAKDSAWSACLACAVADRMRTKFGANKRSGLCEERFERYCWYPSSSKA